MRLFVMGILSICLVGWHPEIKATEPPSAKIDALVERARKGDEQTSERERRVLESDIDADGDLDYTVLFSLSGLGGDDNEMNFMAVLRNEGEQIKSIGPFRLGEEGVWGVDLRNASVTGNILELDYLIYEEGPSKKGRVIYEWDGNGYVPIRREVSSDEPQNAQEMDGNITAVQQRLAAERQAAKDAVEAAAANRERTMHNRFLLQGNGTVLDTQTKLAWTPDDNGFDASTWYEAENYCSKLGPNWALPTLAEFRDVIGSGSLSQKCAERKCNVTPLIRLSRADYWSSDSDNIGYFHIDLSNGASSISVISFARALCVLRP